MSLLLERNLFCNGRCNYRRSTLDNKVTVSEFGSRRYYEPLHQSFIYLKDLPTTLHYDCILKLVCFLYFGL